MAVIYLASPLGFAESTQGFMDVIERLIIDCGYIVINPWRITDSQQFKVSSQNVEKRRQMLHKLNMKVAARNENAIHECQIVVAVLDGTDVDSGTASEIGFAYAQEKRIYGYRGDFRRSGDNDGGIVNLQVQYWIENSGGCIVTSLDALRGLLLKDGFSH